MNNTYHSEIVEECDKFLNEAWYERGNWVIYSQSPPDKHCVSFP